MGNLINTGVISLNEARSGARVPLTFLFSFGQGAILGPEKKALLAVYDLKQYLAHQATLGENRETSQDFFKGKKREFVVPPKHEVRAGTGVLLLAEVTFAPRPKAKDWFVESVRNNKVIASPAFQLEVRCLNSVDSSGNTLSPKVIDLDVVATSGPAEEDFAKFTEFGATTRQLTVRLLSLDRKRVLVSQLNPTHCPALRPVSVRYQAALAPLKIFSPAPEPQKAVLPKLTASRFDLTGEYIELIKDKREPKDALDAIAPGVLRVHHIGRAVCGWYTPMPLHVLRATTPSTVDSFGTRIFPADIEETMFSKTRMVFLLGENTQDKPPQFTADCFFTDDKVDPDILIARNDRKPGGQTDEQGDPETSLGELVVPEEKRTIVVITLDLQDDPLFGKRCRRIEIRAPGRRPVIFLRMSASSRLAWSTVEQLLAQNPIPKAQRKEIVDNVVSDLVEPLSPGTMGRITGFVASPEMETLLVAWSRAKADPKQVSQRLAAEGKINDALERLADAIKSVTNANEVPPALIAQVRAVARNHIIEVDGAKNDALDILQKIADDIIERELAKDPEHKPGTVPRELEATMREMARSAAFRGFAAFHIRPARGFLYRFTFKSDQVDLPFGLVFKAGAGGCLVTIEKLDPITKKALDPDGFKPTEFVGGFAAGAVGISFELGIEGGKRKEGGKAPGPQSCDAVSLSNLKPSDFLGAWFTLVLAGASAGAAGGPGLGVSAETQDAVFSITTTGNPPVTLEATLKHGIKLKGKTPGGVDIFKYLKDLKDALKKGDPTKVPIAKGRAALTALSLCKGNLFLKKDAKEVRRPTKDTSSLQEFLEKELDTNALVKGPQFPKGSAELSDDGRKVLEVKLAVLRKILEYPGWMEVEGTASPEWDNASRAQARTRNKVLSQMRADAVLEAIFAAAGKPGVGAIPARKTIAARGKGAEPFNADFKDHPTRGFHLHPFSPVAKQHAAEIATDKKNFYPTLRRVDIGMNGVFAIRIFGL